MDFKNLFSHHLPFKRYFRNLHLSSYVYVQWSTYCSLSFLTCDAFVFSFFCSSFFSILRLTKWKIECLFCELLYRLCLIYDPCFGLRECIKTDYTMSFIFFLIFLIFYSCVSLYFKRKRNNARKFAATLDKFNTRTDMEIYFGTHLNQLEKMV